MKTKSSDPYFFGGPDDESYTAKTPEEYLENVYSPHNVPPEGIEVDCYKRKDVTPEWCKSQASFLFNQFQESFEEEFACDDPVGIEDAEDDFVKATAKLLQRLAKKHARVYQCEFYSSYLYTPNEIRELLGVPEEDFE